MNPVRVLSRLLYRLLSVYEDYEYMAGICAFSVSKDYYPMVTAGLHKLLKGRLGNSRTTTEFLVQQLESVGPEAYTKLMSDLFDLKTSEFDNWDKSDWLCEECLKKFISAHLHLWLLDRKRKGRCFFGVLLADLICVV